MNKQQIHQLYLNNKISFREFKELIAVVCLNEAFRNARVQSLSGPELPKAQ
jgi:hypothetical protein